MLESVFNSLSGGSSCEKGVPQAQLPLQGILRESGLSDAEINPLIHSMFADRCFAAAIPEEYRNSPSVLGSWLRNSSLFSNLRSRQEEFLGDTITHAISFHADGRIRPEEQGRELLISEVEKLGIDPARVLYFRRTLPSPEEKPEYYWTSDYWETVKGLRREMSEEMREQTVILVSTLADIAMDSRLVVDGNDDHGIAVRRESLGGYDQSRALFSI